MRGWLDSMKHRSTQVELITQKVNALSVFHGALQTSPPWDSIIDFATHKSFCGVPLYPRQRTLLKVIYLETENFTDYDLEVIEEWRNGFLSHAEVCGIQPDIFARINWLKVRGYRHFPHVQMVVGRRGSKGLNGGVIGAERMAFFWWLDDWQKYFGVKPHSDGYLSVIATTIDQARRYQFNDIKLTIEGCAYLRPHISTDKEYYISLRTPTDIRYMGELIAARVPIEREIASLKAMAFSANSASSRGGAGFANFYDEFAHQITGTGSNKTGEEIYGAGQPSLRQFKRHALTYMPSTPLSQIGKFFELYNEGCVLLNEDGTITRVTERSLKVDAEEVMATKVITANPTKFIAQFPSWELYRDWDRSPSIPVRTPKYYKAGMKVYGPIFKEGAIVEYDEELQIEERVNPEKFRVEYRSQFATVPDAYLKPEKVEAMYDPLPWRDALSPQVRGTFTHRYLIHCDPGRSGANFAMCIGHLEKAPPVEERIKDKFGKMVTVTREWDHVVVDYLKVWRPMDYDDGVVDYVEVKDDITNVLERFQSTTQLSFDQWQSSLFLAELKREFSPAIRIVEKTFTAEQNWKRFERFKSALNLGWVHAYRDNFYKDDVNCLLELELKFLQEKNGKVDRQEVGPVTTKDLADCLMVVTTELLHSQHDRWWNDRVNTGQFGSTDVAGLKHGREMERFEAVMGKSGTNTRSSKVRQKIAEQRVDRARGISLDRINKAPTRGRFR